MEPKIQKAIEILIKEKEKAIKKLNQKIIQLKIRIHVIKILHN